MYVLLGSFVSLAYNISVFYVIELDVSRKKRPISQVISCNRNNFMRLELSLQISQVNWRQFEPDEWIFVCILYVTCIIL